MLMKSLVLAWTRMLEDTFGIPVVDPTESKSFLLERQEQLLTSEAESILKLLVHNEPSNKKLQRDLQLLQECRTDGIDAAYEKYSRELVALASVNFVRWKETPEAKRVIEKIVEWANQPDKESSRKFLEANRDDLLTFYAMMTLQYLSEQSEQDLPDVYRFRKLSELFQLCRKQGIDSAYDSFDTLVWHQDLVDLISEWFRAPVKAFLIHHQDRLLSDEADYVLSEILSEAPNWGTELYLKLIRQARRDGIDAAIEAFHQAENAHYAEHLTNLFMGWLALPTWEGSKAYLKEHSGDLLTEQAAYAAVQTARQMPDNQMIFLHMRLLEAARKMGIDEAYEELEEILHEERVRGEASPATGEAQESLEEPVQPRRSWWRRMFGG
jgi:hypothetical protein